MQKDYRYELIEPPGRNFDPDFRPELTPKQMLALGVFCGKYMTDCKDEFPKSWFTRAKLSPERSDCSLNYFGVKASQPLSVWRKKGWRDPSRRPARMVPMVLQVLHGATNARRGRTSNQPLEGHATACAPNSAPLRAGPSHLSPTSAPSSAALGLRQPQNLIAPMVRSKWHRGASSVISAALNAERTRLLPERDDLTTPFLFSQTQAQREGELTQLNGKLYTWRRLSSICSARRWRTGRRVRL